MAAHVAEPRAGTASDDRHVMARRPGTLRRRLGWWTAHAEPAVGVNLRAGVGRAVSAIRCASARRLSVSRFRGRSVARFGSCWTGPDRVAESVTSSLRYDPTTPVSCTSTCGYRTTESASPRGLLPKSSVHRPTETVRRIENPLSISSGTTLETRRGQCSSDRGSEPREAVQTRGFRTDVRRRLDATSSLTLVTTRLMLLTINIHRSAHRSPTPSITSLTS
jgi:hypothetical protein